MEEDSQPSFYKSPIASPITSEKLNMKVLKLTRKCKTIIKVN